MGEVIPARRWVNKDGRTAGLMGAAPFAKDAESEGWSIQQTGWTVRHPDGTQGLGRAPFATQAEAQAWVDAHPDFKGMR